MVHFFHALQQYLLACICIEISHQSCLVFVSFHHAYDGSQAIAQHPEYCDVYGKTWEYPRQKPKILETAMLIKTTHRTLKTNIASDKNIFGRSSKI